MFCCGLGAASEFPHCFLNLNRDNEKNRIINESLKELKMYLSFLKPKYFFLLEANILFMESLINLINILLNQILIRLKIVL